MKRIHLTPEEKADLDERLWKVMNEHVRNNRFFKSAKDFKKEIDIFFKEKLPKIGASLSKRINDNFQYL